VIILKVQIVTRRSGNPFPPAVMVPRGLFEKILSTIAALRPLPLARC
jgi:hypothetical protein